MELAGKRVLVLGLGDTGLSMTRWLAREHASVRVADTRASPPGLAQLRDELPDIAVSRGAFTDADFVGIDLVATSPGVPLSEPAVSRVRARGVPVVGDIELFAHALQRCRNTGSSSGQRGPRTIAVTGTNGKSTVTALAGRMCVSAGLDCEVAGNIGPPVLDALRRRRETGSDPEAWVLELSSFQLETTASLDASAATMLNISEDHLDRYASLTDYVAAKARIFLGNGTQVLNRDEPMSLSMARPGRKIVTFGLGAPSGSEDFGLRENDGRLWLAQGTTPLFPVDEMKLTGLHNAANALAAMALCSGIGVPLEPALAALRAFQGLPHRVELIGTSGGETTGVDFYDDSKGTNVGATVAALNGLAASRLKKSARIVLIAGGEGKTQNFSPLGAAVARTARAVVLIGRDAPLIHAALEGSDVPVRHAETMEQAVEIAAAAAHAGDAVLLSPACASFDMYRNYRHRGEVFRDAVQRFINAAPI